MSNLAEPMEQSLPVSGSHMSLEEFDRSLSPHRVQRKDLVCFVDSSNKLRIGRVKENAREYQHKMSETFLGLVSSIVKKPAERERNVLVRVGSTLGLFEQPCNANYRHCEVRGGGDGFEFLVDEENICIMECWDVNGFQVKKNGRKGQIEESNKSTQMAHVRVVGTNTIIPFVKVADLQPCPVWKIRFGQTVLFEDWIGRVKLINRQIEVKTLDGSSTTWELKESSDAVSVSNEQDMYWQPDLPYFIGQEMLIPVSSYNDLDLIRRLIIDGSSFLPKCATVSQSCILQPPAACVLAKVSDIKIKLIQIEWLKRIPGSEMTEPMQTTFENSEAEAIWKQLKVLDNLSGDFVKIGSQRIYKIKDKDKLLTAKDAQDHLLQSWFPDRFEKKQFKSLKNGLPGQKVAVEVVMVYSGIQVVWEDGTVDLNSSPKLRGCIYSCPQKLAEFSVGAIVVPNASVIMDDVYAVIQRIFPNDFTVSVKWFKLQDDGKCMALNVDVVSCFDIIRLEDVPVHSTIRISWRPCGDKLGSVVSESKTCIVRRTGDVQSFKAAVLLRCHHANHNGMLTAFCGNEAFSISPFDILNCKEIFDGNKVTRHRLVQILPKPTSIVAKNPVCHILHRTLELNCDEEIRDNFSILEKAPLQHCFYSLPYNPKESKFTERLNAFRLDFSLHFNDIWICTYKDRLDLFSALISGLPHTPYYGGLFAFEMYLPKEYPEKIPLIVYVGPLSLPNSVLGQFDTSKRITSLLGFPDFQSNKWNTNFMWDPKSSTLKDVLFIMRDLIHLQHKRMVVLSPFQTILHHGLVIVEILNAAYRILLEPKLLAPWGSLIARNYPVTIKRLVKLVLGWMSNSVDVEKPNFNLLPMPDAIVMSFKTRLNALLPLLDQCIQANNQNRSQL